MCVSDAAGGIGLPPTGASTTVIVPAGRPVASHVRTGPTRPSITASPPAGNTHHEALGGAT